MVCTYNYNILNEWDNCHHLFVDEQQKNLILKQEPHAQDNIKEVKDNQCTSVVAVRQPLEVEQYKS